MPTLDLLSLILTLSPTRPAPAPDWWGKAAHHLALQLIQSGDPALAEEIHDSKTPPPFTVSTLYGRFPNRRVDPAESYRLRLAALSAPVANCFKEALLLPQVELEDLAFAVVSVGVDPLAPPVTYPELAARYLKSDPAPAPPALALSFDSPTFFQDHGRQVADLLPRHVFGSLLRRWNALSPLAFVEDLDDWAEENLEIIQSDLRQQRVFAAGGWHPGKTGRVTYACSGTDAYSLAALQVLADFAVYAGVGAKTAMGFGQARRVVAPGPQPA
jgi:CRISPR-associated endoribonuclease Cas6